VVAFEVFRIVVVAAIVGKVFFGVRGAVIARRENLISSETLSDGAVVWASVALITIAAFSFALVEVVSFWAVAATVILVLPVSRIIWQVIALERSRHGQI
jgi:hypothetical protein